ncbi:transposase [Pantoea sp. GM01]|nr:transposase [Pantoea sp. GM01]
MSGKRYPEEFKIEAVKQVVDRGYSVSSVATRLDITTHNLRSGESLSCRNSVSKWRRISGQDHPASTNFRAARIW